MKTKMFFVLSLVAFIEVSCVRQTINVGNSINWDNYPVVELSNPDTLYTKGLEILSEQKYFVYDSCIIMYPLYTQTYETQYCTLKDDTLVWKNTITKVGGGPMELSSRPPQIAKTIGGDFMLASTGYQTKVFTLPRNKCAYLSDLKHWNIHPFPTNLGFIDQCLPIDSTRFMITTVGDVPSLLATYTLGDTVLSYIPFPYPQDDLNNISKTMSYYGKLFRQSSSEKFLFVGCQGRYAFIYELDETNTMRIIEWLYNAPPMYKKEKDGVNVHMTDDSWMGIIACATENCIYMLVREFTMGDFMDDTYRIKTGGYSDGYTKKVYVFDWEGNPLRTFTFDTNVANITVDSTDSTLYCTTKDLDTDEVTVIRYRLK